MLSSRYTHRADRLLALFSDCQHLGVDLFEARRRVLVQMRTACVMETLRVLRVSKRTSMPASSARTEWLSAEGDTPSCALRSPAARGQKRQERLCAVKTMDR